MLESLGIYGWESVENPILAALLTGDPTILISDPGAAKTMGVGRIEAAINQTFHSYDASMANFEDIIGYPWPATDDNKKGEHKHLVDGEMKFMKTPVSVWDKGFILIDELNRARVDTQNNFLTLLRDRKVQGVKMENLCYTWAAVNPVSEEGTQPLSFAVADRFAWIIPIPEYKDIPTDKRQKIARSMSSQDSMATKLYNSRFKTSKAEAKKDFIQFLVDAAEVYTEIMCGGGEDLILISKYVASILKDLGNMPDGNFAKVADGRRASMLTRNIASLASVLKVLQGKYDLEQAAITALQYSFPCALYSESIPYQTLLKFHEIHKGQLAGKEKFLASKLAGLAPEYRILELCHLTKTLPQTAVSNIFASAFVEMEQDQYIEQHALMLHLGDKILSDEKFNADAKVLASRALARCTMPVIFNCNAINACLFTDGSQEKLREFKFLYSIGEKDGKLPSLSSDKKIVEFQDLFLKKLEEYENYQYTVELFD
ncbi:MAG: hypothetical protein DRM99_05435 [Thermoplasmata archaeon]|nr:MAG: hypothetical protein DRM99_05435 [Thermoplasmata archaeon]